MVSSVFAQTPSFKVAWKEGIILGLLVPSNTTKQQLEDLVNKLRKAKKENKLSSMLPPINLGLSDKYSIFTIFIFADPKWATPEEYKKYEMASMTSQAGKSYFKNIFESYNGFLRT
jgi:hypothetical protein